MNKGIHLIFIFSLLFSSGFAMVEHTVVMVGAEPAHLFEVTDPTFPPYYYNPDTDSYPADGYSYTWHTDEGAISNEKNPRFFFANAGSHDVYLTLTPRKKGEDDLKTSFVYNFFVDSTEVSTTSNGTISDLDMYMDGEGREGDKILIIVPLEACQQVGLSRTYKVGFDDTKLEYLGMLSQSNMTIEGVFSHADEALGEPLNSRVHFQYNWVTHRDDVAAVIEFKVLADVRESVVLKYHKPKQLNCDSDGAFSFRTITGPYDPNYKTSDIAELNVFEKPDKKVNETEVLYTIHFQNIGEGPVDSVTIMDLLPPHLAFLSFEGSSEPAALVTATATGSMLQWIVAPNADIKGTNESPSQPEPSTKGWVRFKAEISKEQEISYDTCYCLANTAIIYFDTLAPIATEPDIIVIGDSFCFAPLSIGPPHSETFCSTLTDTTSSKTERKEQRLQEVDFALYPNPFNDVIQWSGVTGEVQKVEVYSANGHRVAPVSIQAGEINLSDQPSGIYFIRIVTDHEQQVAPVMKH